MKKPLCRLCETRHWRYEAHVKVAEIRGLQLGEDAFRDSLTPSDAVDVTKLMAEVTKPSDNVTEVGLNVTEPMVEVTKRIGRPPLGEVAMTAAERKRRQRRFERTAQTRGR
jgi:hypothetical protein